MEIFLNGPGGTVSTWDLTEAAYNYWKDKPRKLLFDFSWNMPDLRSDNVFDEEHPPRNKLGIPDQAYFFKPFDTIWRNGEEGIIFEKNNFKGKGWCIDVCEYDKATIYVEEDNEVTQYHPDEIPTIRFEKIYKPPSELFYSAVSTEIGNWQHKMYNKSIPLRKFRLHTIHINDKKWIFNLDTSQRENWDMYEWTRTDWSYRLHVRNKPFVDDLSSFTGIDLSYDMNTGNHEQDSSHFKVHDIRIR